MNLARHLPGSPGNSHVPPGNRSPRKRAFVVPAVCDGKSTFYDGIYKNEFYFYIIRIKKYFHFKERRTYAPYSDL